MSVIQKIRNKYIGLVVAAIVVALIGFLVMDAMQSNVNGLFGSDRTLMASINGSRIDYRKFEEKRQQYEDNMAQNSPDGKVSDEQRKQIREQVYNDMVNDILLTSEIEKLGINVSDAEFKDMQTGQFIDPSIRQGFTDRKTGIFDPNKVSEYIGSLGQDKTGEARKKWSRYEEALVTGRAKQKYMDMISKGIYIPKFVVDQDQKTKAIVSQLNYVTVPYSSVSDSSIKISDEEIKTYMEAHSSLYKTREDMAKAEYVSFDILPSSEDTALSLGKLNELKNEFMTTTESETMATNNSDEIKPAEFLNEDKIEMPNPAEVMAAPVGMVIGPQYMNGGFKMVKVLDKRQIPDSAKATHILVKTDKRTDEEAKKTIDSIEAAVKGGASIEALAAQLSEDEGSKQKGGDLGFFPKGTMVKEFNDACFEGKEGDLKVVKTQFGYHLIKIVAQKEFKPAVKLATMVKLLQPGSNTTNAIFAKASEFANKVKDEKSFNEVAKTMGKEKRVAEGISRYQYEIAGIGECRDMSKWAFESNIGAVSPVFHLTDNTKYVIAVLKGKTSKGEYRSIEDMRPAIETTLRKDKKATMIAEKYKGKSSLEEIAGMSGIQVKTQDTVKIVGGNNELAYEPRVLGYCMNKANLNKVGPGVEGEAGVYFMFLKNIGTDPTAAALPMEMQKQQMEQQLNSQVMNIVPYILKNKAKVEDHRDNF